MNIAEERKVADAIFNLRRGHLLPALAVLEHLQAQSHLAHNTVPVMKREVQR
jgi:hypothetical protein